MPITVRSTGSYRQGLRHGVWESRAEEGHILERGAYLAGKREGQWTRLHENGQKREEAFYRAGMLTDYLRRWDEQGHVLTDVRLPNGSGMFIERTPSGQIVIQGRLLAGERHGRWRWWFESGKLEEEGHYRRGQEHGRWTRW